MKDFIVIADSTCDLGKDIREQYQIDYARMNIIVNNKEMVASLDWDNYTPKELYDWMRNGQRVYTTQVPHDEFVRIFTKYLDQGKDVLYISCSSALSGSINMARQIKDEILVNYPDARIECVDSLNSCLGQGSMCVKAASMRQEGKTLDEVVAYLEENKLSFNQFCAVDSLSYLSRAGRIKATKAFFGNLFGVKPILISDAIGQNYAIKKTKGRKASLNELVEMTKNDGVDLEHQILYIAHADCESDALLLKSMLEEAVHPAGFYINNLGPIIGASAGPGTIAVYCIGKKVEVIGE